MEILDLLFTNDEFYMAFVNCFVNIKIMIFEIKPTIKFLKKSI